MRPSSFPDPSRSLHRSSRRADPGRDAVPSRQARISILVDGSLRTRLVFAVSGEIDLATAGELELPLQAALAAGCRCVIVDLSALRFCGAAGLDVFARTRAAFELAGRVFTLTGPSASLTRYLSLVGLGSLIDPGIPSQPGCAAADGPPRQTPDGGIVVCSSRVSAARGEPADSRPSP